ncbi:CDP-glycerol glycerophosphotransferase [Glycomyces xiaoerkulensis]|uniref:CDP-glycerol glycerophosphotransferase n=1 Tax=Glycomyces xiaoerkulensis TaxID=2038139 RepID=UPI0013000D05|nr:CDP-glycerol glycerophosphotransferase [Glycomyces xiaoerkulensis]
MKSVLMSWTSRLNLIALAAVAAAVTVSSPLPAFLAAATVFVVVAWHDRRAIATRRIARILGALAVLIAAWRDSGLDRWPLLAAGGMLVLYFTYTDIVKRALDIYHLTTRHLDVHRTRREQLSAPASIAFAVNGLCLGFVFAAVVGTWPWAAGIDVVALVATVAVLGWTASVVLSNAIRRRAESHPVDTAVAEAVADLAPRFVVHFAGAPRSEYQIRMWLPYFDLVGDPYLVIVRDRYLLRRVASATEAPIVLVSDQSVLDRLLPESVGACFYSNHAVKNVQMIKLSEYMHVQLMHGDSDKAISRSPVSLMYDRVFVAGRAGVDRYHRNGVDLPEYKFRLIGRPQLHGISVGPRERDADEPPTVLYTPTWAGLHSDTDYSSLPEGRTIVEALLRRGVRVIFRAHPYTATSKAYLELADRIRELLAEDAARTGRDHWWGRRADAESTLTDCINAADAAVSDISGTASDWLYCGRPLAMTDPRGFRDRYVDQFPLARAAYLLEPDAGNLEQVLDRILVDDPLQAVRAEVREYYLGDIAPEDLIDVFRDEVRATYLEEAADSAFASG